MANFHMTGVNLLVCILTTATAKGATLGASLKYGRLSEPMHYDGEDVGEPLNLSHLLATGEAIESIRSQSQVSLDGWPRKSYSGFFTTQAATNNQMFFWYFPSQNPDPNSPLLVWLQGGPGGSSLFGLFAEMGPFSVDANGKLSPRSSSWNTKYGMLFIDNPVGAGFSFTTQDAGYCKNSTGCVAANLYSLLQQFYLVFPDQQKTDLYITGESYGGHYVPAISAYIHQQNMKKKQLVQDADKSYHFEIPLRGMAIGDGWIDPVNMVPGYPDMVYNMGLCDENEKKIIQSYCTRTVDFITQGKMTDAFNVWDQMLNGDIWPYANYFHNITGSNDYDNFLNTNAPADFGYYASYVNQPATRRALHVGNLTFNDGHDCEMHLLADFMVSLKPELELMLNSREPEYKVLIYSGQLDVIIGAALTERFLPSVEWHGQAAYNAAKKSVWRIEPSAQDVAGYARQVGNFTQVVVRGAGHIVPGDQPARALDMISRFVEGRSYENLPNPAQTF